VTTHPAVPTTSKSTDPLPTMEALVKHPFPSMEEILGLSSSLGLETVLTLRGVTRTSSSLFPVELLRERQFLDGRFCLP
jgi:hypothetical protein